MSKNKTNTKKPTILNRNEMHAEIQRNTRGVVHEDKTKRIPRKEKYKKNTRDYL